MLTILTLNRYLKDPGGAGDPLAVNFPHWSAAQVQVIGGKIVPSFRKFIFKLISSDTWQMQTGQALKIIF